VEFNAIKELPGKLLQPILCSVGHVSFMSIGCVPDLAHPHDIRVLGIHSGQQALASRKVAGELQSLLSLAPINPLLHLALLEGKLGHH